MANKEPLTSLISMADVVNTLLCPMSLEEASFQYLLNTVDLGATPVSQCMYIQLHLFAIFI